MARRHSEGSRGRMSKIRGWSKMSKKAKEAFSRNARKVSVAADACNIHKGMSRAALKKAMSSCIPKQFRRGGAASHVNGF